MNENENRRHTRLNHHAEIKVVMPDATQTLQVNMKDLSESGLFLMCEKQIIPPIGTIVQVQTTEFEGAPIQQAKVIRVEEGVGFGVEFLLESS
jgi:hypothetical protein